MFLLCRQDNPLIIKTHLNTERKSYNSSRFDANATLFRRQTSNVATTLKNVVCLLGSNTPPPLGGIGLIKGIPA